MWRFKGQLFNQKQNCDAALWTRISLVKKFHWSGMTRILTMGGQRKHLESQTPVPKGSICIEDSSLHLSGERSACLCLARLGAEGKQGKEARTCLPPWISAARSEFQHPPLSGSLRVWIQVSFAQRSLSWQTLRWSFLLISCWRRVSIAASHPGIPPGMSLSWPEGTSLPPEASRSGSWQTASEWS